MRISNNYLLAIVTLLIKLGAKNVSRSVMVEAWKNAGYECDDVFFMHLDALTQYKLVKPAIIDAPVLELDQLLSDLGDVDEMLSVTHEGMEFLNCFGGR